MEYKFKRATIADIDVLVETRMEAVRTMHGLDVSEDISHVEAEVRMYYEEALPGGEHIAYLAFMEREFVGCGGISFYQTMPSYNNPSGQKAYIMNMYTRQPYRRKGIAMIILDLLVKEAKKREIHEITLAATEMGKPLYEAYGFRRRKDDMTFVE